MELTDAGDPRVRIGAIVVLTVYLAVSVWAAVTGNELALFLADVVFVLAIIPFGLYVRVVQSEGDRLLRVTGSLLVASGLAQAYLMLNPEGPITPAVPNLLIIGGGVLYLWAMSGRRSTMG